MAREASQFNPQDIIELLKSELLIQRRHLDLLNQQRKALLEGSEDEFACQQTAYEAFTYDLELNARRRRKILGPETFPLRPIVGTWSVKERRLGLELLDANKKLIVQVHKVAEQNAQLVSNRLTYIQFILSVMVRAGRNNWGYASPIGNGAMHTENVFVNQVA